MSGPLLFARSLVLEDAHHGPQLCLGFVALSLPPQCGGPDLVGWDWEAVGGYQRQHRTTYGDYVVVGTYDRDARTFTLDRPAVSAAAYEGWLPARRDDPPLGTPRPPPEEGWPVADPGRTTDDDWEALVQAAEDRPDFAYLWLDGRVVNVAVTGDVATAGAELREMWGGPVCVSPARHTQAELRAVVDELTRLPDLLELSHGLDRVDLRVVHDGGTLQAALDARFGPRLVRVTSALQPWLG